MLTRFLFSWICWIIPATLLAQVSFTTATDEASIPLNGILQVQYIVENAHDIKDFQPPVFRDFKIMQGPMETSGMSLVNGLMTQYKALTYVLQPVRKGRLTVPGASAVIDGHKMQSSRVVVEVGEATRNTPPGYPRNPGISVLQENPEEDFLLGRNENAEEKIKKNMLVKLDLDKTSAYIGEPIVATYKLYTRLRSESRVSKRPSMNGFSVYDMIDPENASPTVEKLNGKPFMVHIIRKTELFPLQEGSFTLDPVEVQNNVRFLRTDGGESGSQRGRSDIERMFDDLLSTPSGQWENHQMALASEARNITIKALPAGAPASFNGAVGHFSLTGKLSADTLAAGETGTYTLTIDGAGNLPLINAPAWNLPDSATLFDPVVKEDLNKMVAPMEGSKTFTYSFTVSVTGDQVFPPIAFSYFDPAKQQYATIQTDTIKLHIRPGVFRKNTAGPIPANAIDKSSSNSMLWLLLVGLATLVGGIFWLISRKKSSQQSASQAPPPAPALPAKTDPLAQARKAAEEQDAAGFYKAVDQALWTVVSERLNLAQSAQQRQSALALLAAKGMAATELNLLNNCWQQCEWALYMPAAVPQLNPLLLREAEQVIRTIEELD